MVDWKAAAFFSSPCRTSQTDVSTITHFFPFSLFGQCFEAFFSRFFKYLFWFFFLVGKQELIFSWEENKQTSLCVICKYNEILFNCYFLFLFRDLNYDLNRFGSNFVSTQQYINNGLLKKKEQTNWFY